MSTIEELVAELVATKEDTPDDSKVKELKQACQHDKSNQSIVLTFQALVIQLGKRQSRVRLLALHVFNELFIRSHHFRLLATNELAKLFELIFGAYRKKLPPPAAFAKQLQCTAAEYYFKWVKRFGSAYQRLIYGYRYLKNIEHVDFGPAIQAFKLNDPQRIQRLQQRKQRDREEYMRRSLISVQADYLRVKPRVEEALIVLRRCFAILVPEIADIFDETVPNSVEDDSDLDDVLAVMAANRQAIDISIDPERVLGTEEGPENTAVFDVIREYLQLCMIMYKPRVQLWVDKLVRIDPKLDENVEQLTESAKKLLRQIAESMDKSRDLGINLELIQQRRQYEDESGDEFEEVEPIAPSIQPKQQQQKQSPRNAVFAMLGKPVLKQDPTYIDPMKLREQHKLVAPKEKDTGQSTQNPIEERLRETAPVVRFDTDLMYWGQQAINANTSGLEIRHRFLGNARDEPMMSEAAKNTLQKRAVYYQQPERSEIRACRAPLRDGRLCPRRDLVKCPFHGVIIPRDEQGRPEAGYEIEAKTEAEAEPAESSIATAERIEDLRWQDVAELERLQQRRKRRQLSGRTRSEVNKRRQRKN
ncbi:hypothetical protein IWW36_004415 [Coemansia brasiliensis]|uniref:UV-stimulated scaffold protein A C-terminal domain-containing protein n=1 Tax=Coemansia brasiliensis TaxID=2650707 RepID=A0A9W8I3H8_9FUNG|nr:hypothetical protein IWW36_004415 [Coemansia brasiliensis]